MIIEVGNHYINAQGEIVELIDDTVNAYNVGATYCIWFKDLANNYHVLTHDDFSEQFKLYEPIFEYQYAYMHEGTTETTALFYKDNTEFYEAYKNSFNGSYQRLDFTKRERKC